MKQEAQLMLTNPRHAFRGQSRSPNVVKKGKVYIVYRLGWHKFKLSARTSALSDCNFVTRMLFKTKGYR